MFANQLCVSALGESGAASVNILFFFPAGEEIFYFLFAIKKYCNRCESPVGLSINDSS